MPWKFFRGVSLLLRAWLMKWIYKEWEPNYYVMKVHFSFLFMIVLKVFFKFLFKRLLSFAEWFPLWFFWVLWLFTSFFISKNLSNFQILIFKEILWIFSYFSHTPKLHSSKSSIHTIQIFFINFWKSNFLQFKFTRLKKFLQISKFQIKISSLNWINLDEKK